MEDDADEFLIELESEYRTLGEWGAFDPPPVGGPPFRSQR
jgi:hypothetical protein